MQKNQKWFAMLYVFYIVIFASILWVIVLAKQLYFEKNFEYTSLKENLYKNISLNFDTSIKNHIENNSNSWLYIPIISCPNNVGYLSWTNLLYTWQTSFENNTCSWVLNSQNLVLYYTWNYTNFASWILWSTWFSLTWTNTLTWNLGSYTISFDKPTIFDDRFIKARTQISWILLKNAWWRNIFWNNTKINNFISSNTNNKEPFLNLWHTSSGIVYLNVNWAFSWKIVEFDKNIFDNQNKLVKINEINFSSSWWVIWYLQNDLSFSWAVWNPKIFNFILKDYAIFLSYNTWSLNNIKYTLEIFSNTWTWVYINPIKDNSRFIEYLWNYILINNWQYYNKIYKLTNY